MQSQARARAQGEVSSPGLGSFQHSALELGQLLGEKDRAGFSGVRIMEKREENLVLEWDCLVKILILGQGIHMDLYHITEDLPKCFMPHLSFT